MSTHIRVSEILAQFRDFSAIDVRVLNTKANIGTEVHHNIHMYARSMFPVFDTFPIYDRSNTITGWSERGEGYFNSYLDYCKNCEEWPRYWLMEHRLYDDNLMITGQIDALMLTDELPILVDFKCSYAVDEEIWGMQAHFYKHLLEINGFEIADYFLFLQLKKDGKKPKIVKIMYDEKMMSRCIREAILFWERKKDAK